MNTVVKVIGSAILLICAYTLYAVGPTLALTMAYLMWGWKGALFTIGLLLSK